MIEFDAEHHQYRKDGKLVEGTSNIIQAAGLGVDFGMVAPNIVAAAAELGTMVHAGCAMLLHIGPDCTLEQFPETVDGYLRGMRQFLADTRFEPLGIEQPLLHPVYGYAGTPDAWGILNDQLIVIDVKTPLKASRRSWMLQLAAYKSLITFNSDRRVHWGASCALQLKPTGTYKLVSCDDPIAEQTFLACLAELRGQRNETTTALIAAWRRKYP